MQQAASVKWCCNGQIVRDCNKFMRVISINLYLPTVDLLLYIALISDALENSLLLVFLKFTDFMILYYTVKSHGPSQFIVLAKRELGMCSLISNARKPVFIYLKVVFI